MAVAEGNDSSRAVDEHAAHDEVDPRPEQGLTGDGLGTLKVLRQSGKTAVGSEYDIGIKNGDERVEVAVPGRGKERLDDLPLGGEVRIWSRSGTAYATPRTARKLAGCLGRALHDRRDLLERHREHVVQHERQSFGRSQCFEHDQQRKAD